MGMKDKDAMRWIKRIFFVLAIGVLLFFVLAESFLPPENATSAEYCELYEGQWERVYPDGSREHITVPGKCEAYRNEAVIIETVLPEELDDGSSICLRSSHQDFEIYVDGMLRQRYTTKDTRPFGKTSMSAYVFADIYGSDGGKTLRIISNSDSIYTGQINEMYIGNHSAITNYFIRTYGVFTLVTIMIILLSGIAIGASALLKYVFHKEVVLNYLGWGVFFTALWMLAESKLRQFLLPNNSVFGSIAFFCVMMLPFPFILYVDSIQQRRYHKGYLALGVAATINFIVCTTLQVCSIVDFMDTLVLMHILLACGFVLIAVTVITDWKRKQIADYWMISIGFLGMIVAAIIEIICFYLNTNHARGFMICIGLVFLLGMASVKTGKDLMKKETETHIAVKVGQSKADFLANMSHEIRTPINTVIGMNEMILRENQDESIKEYAQNIKRASNMLLALIDDVLDFSKIEAGRMEVVETEYNLNNLLKDVIQVLTSKAGEKGLETEIVIDEQLPCGLWGDEIRIKQVLNNLVTNAVKYTTKGKVSFRVSGSIQEESQLVLMLEIEDTGIGIRKEDMSKLFESFTRLEQNKNRSIQGTGLGLSITKRLIGLMQGELKVNSVYGKGSCFTVEIPQKITNYIPLAEAEKVMDAKEEEEQEEIFLYAPKASVLVVDDNDMNLEVFKALLKRTGIQVDTASSGKQSLSMCATKKYDLIFMDHMMPEMDGIQTLHCLRKEVNFNQQTKVIALTANAIAGSREIYLSEGFDDYLSKPISSGKLETLLFKYLPDELKEEVNKDKKTLKSSGQSNIGQIDAQELQLINKESAMPYCCNSDEMYYEMLKIYLTQAEKYVEKLPLCYEEKDWENYSIITHAIKSTSLTIGANHLSELAKEHEMASKAKDETFLQEKWEEFFDYYQTVLECGKKMALK